MKLPETARRVADLLAAIGHAAATMLLQRMEGRMPEPAQIDLGYTLVVREST